MLFNEKKRTVCYHEAGHWVVANRLGFKTGDITIEIQKYRQNFGHQGTATIFPRLNSNSTIDIDTYLKNRISVLFSGVLAQTLIIEQNTEETASDLLRTDGANDYKTITELLYILRGVRHSKQECEKDEEHILSLQTECWTFADKTVTEMKSTISHLAHNMADTILIPNKTYTFDQRQLVGWVEAQSPTYTLFRDSVIF